MRGQQIFIILLLNLVPSHFLKMDREALLYILPQSSVEVGELLYAHLIPNYDLLLNNKKFEPIDATNSAFAVVGLTTSMTETIHKISKRTSYKWMQPTRIWLSQRLQVIRPRLEDASHLRLPSSVWQKVNNAEQAKKDRETMAAILKKEDTINKPFTCMQSPIDSVRVSKYASPRYLPNGKSYYHAGVDQRAFTPTPLKSIGNGTVVYADFMMTPGNIVVVSHGKGLFSRYMHLSQLDVKAGDQVSGGQVIGLTGGTGRVEAPHLHWEVIWKGNHANPENFLLQWGRICDRS
jgi:hypothetical protein